MPSLADFRLLPLLLLLLLLLSMVCLQRLHAVKGLSEAKADKMVEAAKKLTNVGSWITGMEAMQKVSACTGFIFTRCMMQWLPRPSWCLH